MPTLPGHLLGSNDSLNTGGCHAQPLYHLISNFSSIIILRLKGTEFLQEKSLCDSGLMIAPLLLTVFVFILIKQILLL